MYAKRVICIAIAAIFVIMSIVGCSPQAPAPVPTVAPTTEIPATPPPVEIDIEGCVFDADQKLYNILPAIAKDGHELCYAGYRDEDEVILMYSTNNNHNYVLSILNVESGILNDVFTSEFYGEGEGEGLVSLYVSVFSVKPFAFRTDNDYVIHIVNEDFTEETTLSGFDYNYQLCGMANSETIIAFNNSDNTVCSINTKDENAKETVIASIDYRYRFITMNSMSADGRYVTFEGTDAYDQDDAQVAFVVDTTDGEVKCQTTGRVFLFDEDGKVGGLTLSGEWNDDEDPYTEISTETFLSFDDTDIVHNVYRFDDVYVANLAMMPDNESLIFPTSEVNECGVTYFDFDDDEECSFSINIEQWLSGTEGDSYIDMSVNAFSGSGDDEFVFLLHDGFTAQALMLWLPDDDTYTVVNAKHETAEYPLNGKKPHSSTDYGELSDYADELSDKYGITFLIGEDALLTMNNYELIITEREKPIREALDMFDHALAKYPEGFFESLKKDYLNGIIFTVGEKLQVKDSPEAIAHPAAVTCEIGSYNILAFSTDYLYDGNIYHEIAHMIDNKLDNLAMNDSNLKWSDEGWNALNPEGFEYFHAYVDEEGNEYTWGYPEYTPDGDEYPNDPNSVYFMETYSKTFATEDRATMMEQMLSDFDPPKYMRSTHMTAKLHYYFEAIRQALDPDGTWNEPTYWENNLEYLEGLAE